MALPEAPILNIQLLISTIVCHLSYPTREVQNSRDNYGNAMPLSPGMHTKIVHPRKESLSKSSFLGYVNGKQAQEAQG